MKVTTEIIDERREEGGQSLFDDGQAMIGASVGERMVVEGSRFGHEFSPCATVSVSHAAPPPEGPIFPRNLEEPIENITDVAWKREREEVAMPTKRVGRHLNVSHN